MLTYHLGLFDSSRSVVNCSYSGAACHSVPRCLSSCCGRRLFQKVMIAGLYDASSKNLQERVDSLCSRRRQGKSTYLLTYIGFKSRSTLSKYFPKEIETKSQGCDGTSEPESTTRLMAPRDIR